MKIEPESVVSLPGVKEPLKRISTKSPRRMTAEPESWKNGPVRTVQGAAESAISQSLNRTSTRTPPTSIVSSTARLEELKRTAMLALTLKPEPAETLPENVPASPPPTPPSRTKPPCPSVNVTPPSVPVSAANATRVSFEGSPRKSRFAVPFRASRRSASPSPSRSPIARAVVAPVVPIATGIRSPAHEPPATPRFTYSWLGSPLPTPRTMSTTPSPSTSAIATELAFAVPSATGVPVFRPSHAPVVAWFLLFRKSLLAVEATTRSAKPSPLTSPTATATPPDGVVASALVVNPAQLPLVGPWFRWTVTALAVAITRSGRASALTSPSSTSVTFAVAEPTVVAVVPNSSHAPVAEIPALR